jgi:hypothetical protein
VREPDRLAPAQLRREAVEGFVETDAGVLPVERLGDLPADDVSAA